MSDKTEANPVLQKNKSNNTSNEQSKEPDMKTRFNMLRKMKEDLEKMNRRERRYVVEDEDNDNVHSIKAESCYNKKKDDKNSLLKLVEKKKKKMMIQKKYESMNGVNTGIIQENNESEEESNSKSNTETPHKFKEGMFMNSLNNVKEFKTEDDVMMVNKEEKDRIVEEDEGGNGSDEQNGNEDNKEDVNEEDKKEEEEKIKEEKNIIKQRLLKLALDKKMKKEEEIKEKSKDVNINNDEGNNGDDDDDQNENNNNNDVNDDNNKNDNDETEFNPSSLLLKDNSSSKKELRNIINILKSKSNKQQQIEPTSDTNTNQIVPNETSPQKTTTSQDNNNNTSDSPNNKANNSSSNDDDDNNNNDNNKDNNNNNDNPPQPPELTEEEQQQLQYKKELEERAIKRNKYLEFKKQQVIQKRKYEEELAEQKRLEEIQRKEEERLAEIEKKRKEELIRLERQQQAEAREAEKKKREERKRRDAMRKAGEQRLEREVKRQEQRKEFEFKRLELKLNNKGKDVITVNGSFDRSIDNINNESNSNYFSELTYVKQTPISKRKNICDIASSPKIDDVKKDNFRQNNKIDIKKNNVFETETKIKMKAPVTLIYSPKRAGRSSSNDKLSRSIVDVNEIKENKAYNANQPYVKQRSGGLSVGKKNNNVNVSNYNSQYNNNINVRKNPFMNYNNNNNINMNNRTQTNFGQDALIDDHYTTINHHHHNITNIRTNFYTTMPNFNYNTNNNSNNNSNINNNTNSNSNNSINQINNNNINNYSQVGSLLPPAPPTPQPKAQYSLNIEDLITLEEKLSEITSALNLNQYIRNECFEWWNYYFNHSNYSQIHLTFDKAHQPFIERSIKYQILSILICYDVSSDQYVLSSIEHMIQAILNRNHMNFILVCEYVLSKISLDNYDNVWVYKLRNLVNTHKINYVNFINEYGDNVSYVDKINSNTNSVINDIRIIVKYYQNSNPKAVELLFLLKKIEQLSYNEINAIVQEKFMIGQKMNSNILPYDYNYNSSLRESNNFNFFSENTSCNMGVNGGNGNNYFNGGNNSGFYLDTQDVYGNNLEMNGNYY